MGLLVLLKDHSGSEDLARLADDLDLEIDEILPAVEFAEALQIVTVTDGKVTLTEGGRKLLSGTIGARKSLLRAALRTQMPFAQILKAIDHTLTKKMKGEELTLLLSKLNLPSDVTFENIITWGRFTELLRYDAEDNVIRLPKRKAAEKTAT